MFNASLLHRYVSEAIYTDFQIYKMKIEKIQIKFLLTFGGIIRYDSTLWSAKYASLDAPPPGSTSNLSPRYSRVAFVICTRLENTKFYKSIIKAVLRTRWKIKVYMIWWLGSYTVILYKWEKQDHCVYYECEWNRKYISYMIVLWR